jgi:hypothetical protein
MEEPSSKDGEAAAAAAAAAAGISGELDSSTVEELLQALAPELVPLAVVVSVSSRSGWGARITSRIVVAKVSSFAITSTSAARITA